MRAPDPALVTTSLCRLGRVRAIAHLGRNGPLDAAGPGGPFGNALFGRDSMFMAMDLMDDFPEVSRATIMALAALQGVKDRVRSEEEPGRILHENRGPGPYDNPRWTYPYYGSVDATPLYVKLVDAHVQRCGSEILSDEVQDRAGRTTTLRASVERACLWLERRVSAFGLLYVRRKNRHGLANQVWPDSDAAYFFEDGRLLDPEVPYAPACVQGHAYDAFLIGARLTPDARAAKRWHASASRLRQHVLSRLWQPRMRTFALALVYDTADGAHPRPARVVASDAGHLLDSGVLEGDDARCYREMLCQRLMAPDMLCACGIRTRSVGSARFNPGSYHNGSVWPVDTARIAAGLRRHGYAAEADTLEERILNGCAQVKSMVEFFRGDTDGVIRITAEAMAADVLGECRIVEPTPQPNQGWTASCVWRIMRRRKLISF
jgi:glycogen debranching enzyme